MAGKLKLSMMTGDYESVRALKEGDVEAEGIELVIPDFPGAREIHIKMAEGAYDIGEFNACAYMAAKCQGREITALPVFLHRRFRHGFVFTNVAKNITKPTDLIGKRVGGTNFNPAGNVWIRGILENEYDVPHRSITWVTERDEDVPFEFPDDLRVERIEDGQDLEVMLAEGELDAMISPNVVRPIEEGDARVGRLFPDYKEIEIDFFQRTGIFPIMHVTIIRQEIVDENPWVIESLTAAFEESKQIAYARLINPRIVPLAWYRSAWEEERRLLGPDPWEYGLSETNRKNLEMAIGFVHQQGMTDRRMTIEELFAGA